jgi:hypothetical protein
MEDKMSMLFDFLNALTGESKDTNKAKGKGGKKLTQREKDRQEYQLWVRAEEYEDDRDE